MTTDNTLTCCHCHKDCTETENNFCNEECEKAFHEGDKMNRVSTLNQIKKALKDIPYIESYNRFALMWLCHSNVEEVEDKVLENKGYNELKLTAGTASLSVPNGTPVNSELFQKVKFQANKREYGLKFEKLEEAGYWDIIKAIDAAWETFKINANPRAGDYRILLQLSSPDLMTDAKIDDCIIKDEKIEKHRLKKWYTKRFKVDRGVLINEIYQYITDHVKG